MIIFLYFYLVWLIIYYYSNLSQFKSISNQTWTNGLYNEETVPSRATALPPSLGPCSTTGLTTGHLEGPAGRVQGQGSMNILLRRENLQETMVPWCTMDTIINLIMDTIINMLMIVIHKNYHYGYYPYILIHLYIQYGSNHVIIMVCWIQMDNNIWSILIHIGYNHVM